MGLNFKTMGKKYTAIGCLMITLFMIAGCLPDPLEIKNIPEAPAQIVINTQIVPDQSLVVLLTRTFGALEASDDTDPEVLLEQVAINDALVILEGPSGYDTLTQLQIGFYGGLNIDFQPGDAYELHVYTAQLGEVHASTTVSTFVPFESIEAELYYTGYDDTLAQVTYSLDDPAGPNYYMVTVQQIERDDPIEEVVSNPRVFTRLVEDVEFDGEIFSETFKVFPRDFTEGDTVTVQLSNISKDYYDFIQLRLDNRFSFVEFAGDPINYPTNVRGGRGFFNLFVPDVRVFELHLPQ